MTFPEMAKSYTLEQCKAQLYAARDAGKLAYVNPGEQIADIDLLCIYCGQLRQMAQDKAKDNSEYAEMLLDSGGYEKTLQEIIDEITGKQDYYLQAEIERMNRKAQAQLEARLTIEAEKQAAQPKKNTKTRKAAGASARIRATAHAAAERIDPDIIS